MCVRYRDVNLQAFQFAAYINGNVYASAATLVVTRFWRLTSGKRQYGADPSRMR